MVDLLEYRAATSNGEARLTFLEKGEDVGQVWGFAEWAQRSRAVAATLQQHLQPGDRVLLMFPDGLDCRTLFGCMYASRRSCSCQIQLG